VNRRRCRARWVALQETEGKLASVIPKQITPSNIERKVTP
jgi:hypothetical protein